jgi:UDP-N-acetylglucosamine--N-acetylmuramyl-(pentapeptide) pyrophosphoryl-undecaprenol N-acetylglucosamine transferase
MQSCSLLHIFQIPLPTILDHHQTRNAYIMADIMGAKVITEDELDSSSLTSAVDEIFGMCGT